MSYLQRLIMESQCPVRSLLRQTNMAHPRTEPPAESLHFSARVLAAAASPTDVTMSPAKEAADIVVDESMPMRSEQSFVVPPSTQKPESITPAAPQSVARKVVTVNIPKMSGVAVTPNSLLSRNLADGKDDRKQDDLNSNELVPHRTTTPLALSNVPALEDAMIRKNSAQHRNRLSTLNSAHSRMVVVPRAESDSIPLKKSFSETPPVRLALPTEMELGSDLRRSRNTSIASTGVDNQHHEIQSINAAARATFDNIQRVQLKPGPSLPSPVTPRKTSFASSSKNLAATDDKQKRQAINLHQPSKTKTFLAPPSLGHAELMERFYIGRF